MQRQETTITFGPGRVLAGNRFVPTPMIRDPAAGAVPAAFKRSLIGKESPPPWNTPKAASTGPAAKHERRRRLLNARFSTTGGRERGRVRRQPFHPTPPGRQAARPPARPSSRLRPQILVESTNTPPGYPSAAAYPDLPCDHLPSALLRRPRQPTAHRRHPLADLTTRGRRLRQRVRTDLPTDGNPGAPHPAPPFRPARPTRMTHRRVPITAVPMNPGRGMR